MTAAADYVLYILRTCQVPVSGDHLVVDADQLAALAGVKLGAGEVAAALVDLCATGPLVAIDYRGECLYAIEWGADQ